MQEKVPLCVTLGSVQRRIIALAIVACLPCALFAQGAPFPDIPPGAWYEGAVRSFLSQGFLDSLQPQFRGGNRATRAEFIKLIVLLNGGILDELPEKSRFADVSPRAWFFGFVEEAAREGWVRREGLRGASGKPRVRPLDPVTRAEAAVLMQRGFGKKPLRRAPAFADNPPGTWFSDAIQIAADHCILRGDSGTRTVRPHDPVNRAEMVTMLARVDEGRRYPAC